MSGSYSSRPELARDAHERDTRTLKRMEKVLATSAFNFDSYGPWPGTVRVEIPSSRLKVKIVIAFFGDAGAILDYTLHPGDTPSTVIFQPRVTDERGTEAPMDPLPSVNIPVSIEADTTADVVVAFVNIQSFWLPPPGAIKAVVTWEPTNEMSAEEWQVVKQQCTMQSGFEPGLAFGGGGG